MKKNAQNRSLIHGIVIVDQTSKITHIFFVNESLMICKVDIYKIKELNNILNEDVSTSFREAH